MSSPRKLKSCKFQSKGASNNNGENDAAISLYVHIPYCRRRCRYCNFAIVPIGPNAQTDIIHNKIDYGGESDVNDATTRGFLEMDRAYRQSILQEIEMLRSSPTFSSNNTTVQVQSIYFGGGTPSLAPLETIENVLSALLSSDVGGSNSLPLFSLAPQAEISIEIDPGTLTETKLLKLKELGFNRISLGVQSFDDDILQQIGRIHRRQDILQAVEMLYAVFGNSLNYSIDLISGLPGLSLALWSETLATAVALTPPPSHISLYDLQIEQGTVFGSWYGGNSGLDEVGGSLPSQQTRGSLPEVSTSGNRMHLPSEEECAFMYKYAAGYLRAKGFEHYEVSSYAYVGQPGDRDMDDEAYRRRNRSRHNQIYWAINGQWYAFGLGATSFVEGHMKARPRFLADYHNWVSSKLSSMVDDEQQIDKFVNDHDFLTDVIMKRLRTSDGLDLDWVKKTYGQDCVAAILKGAQLGMELGLIRVEHHLDCEDATSLRLVDPDGFLYSNNLISSIFVEVDEYLLSKTQA